ncbi:MAG: AAA family ATPase [Sandaracinaceae bacterium]
MTDSGMRQDFLRALTKTNPFRQDRVTEPEDLQVDVSDIHARPFRQLRRAIEEVRREETSSGVVILGSPGVGKSHLLARLHGWTQRERTAVFVPLHNLQASAERMGRYLLKATVSSLLGKYASTGLFGLLHGALGDGAQRRGASRSLATSPVDAEILTVLFGFQAALDQPEITEAALTWLRGDPIDEPLAKRLGALGDGRVSPVLQDNAAVERVFIVLARLLQRNGQVLILGVDQVDNLGESQVRSLASFLHTLIDHATNMLVLTSGVRESMYVFRDEGVIPLAAWDRIARDTILIEPLTVDEARSVLEERLRTFFAPFEGIPELDQARLTGSLFPLGEAWWTDRVKGLSQVRARDVINYARRRWGAQQQALETEGPEAWFGTWTEIKPTLFVPRPREAAVDDLVRAKVAERVAQRELNPHGLPPDADNLATLVEIALEAAGGLEGYSLRAFERFVGRAGGRLPAYDVVVEETDPDGRILRTGVAFLTTRDNRTVTPLLRRLDQDGEPPEHAILVTDERVPLRLTEAGRDHLERLQSRRGDKAFLEVPLSFRSYAELDGIVGVLRQARVGDLEVEHPAGEGSSVDEEEARQALHRLDLFRRHPLVGELVTEEPDTGNGEVVEWLLDVGTIEAGIRGLLAWRIGASAVEVTAKLAHDHQLEERQPQLLVQVIQVADEMHRRDELRATPLDDDRFLVWTAEAA